MCWTGSMFELGHLLESVPDPRRAGYRQKYRLCDLLMLALCAVLSGANSFTEMAWYGRLYRPLLVERLGLGFEEDTPSHDIRPKGTRALVFLAGWSGPDRVLRE